MHTGTEEIIRTQINSGLTGEEYFNEEIVTRDVNMFIYVNGEKLKKKYWK